MQTARGPVTVTLALLAMIAAVASCSRSGGDASSTGEVPTPAAQVTPAAPDTAPEANPQVGEQPASGAAEEAPGTPEFRPENAAGAVQGVPAATNTAPIVAVANYFSDLPGIDVAGLKRGQKEKFLQIVNSEICPCGCKNDTLAKCYVNDAKCPVVKSLVQKVYDEVKTGK